MNSPDRTPSDDAPAAAFAQPEVRPLRLLLTLTLAGGLAGALLVLVYEATQPTILAYREKVLQEAVREVLAQPERVDTLYLLDGAVTLAQPEGGNARRVFAGYDASGRRVGFALAWAGKGFQDDIRLIFGFDTATRQLLGMKVLQSKETPGLGDKIEKDDQFVGQFAGAAPPLTGVKPGRRDGTDPGQVDMITGATISSRAVIRIINEALQQAGPALDTYAEEGRS